jgi:hypothetical protein
LIDLLVTVLEGRFGAVGDQVWKAGSIGATGDEDPEGVARHVDQFEKQERSPVPPLSEPELRAREAYDDWLFL